MNEKITRKIEGGLLTIPESKMFTYPTRLNDTWTPGILEIKKPSYELVQPDIEYTIEYGVTNTGQFTGNKLRKLYKKLVPPLKIDKDCIAYDCRYIYEGNIAHMLMKLCHVPLQARKEFTKITLIFTKKAPRLATNIAKMLGLPFMATDKEVEGNILNLSNYKFVDQVLKSYISVYDDLVFEGYNQNTPEKIFISRKGARALINEKEIEELLQKYGFKKYYFEEIPLAEQWSLCKNAKIVVGIHGAALGCLVFNRNPIKLIELFHPGYMVSCYRQLTAVLEGNWCGVIGEITNEYKESDLNKNPRSLANAATKIDPNSLIKALEYLGIDTK